MLSFFSEEPIFSFALLLAVILIVPIGFERLRLPGVLGLLVAGIVLGPQGFRLLSSDSQMMMLLSDIGLLYLMFVAGLEIDLAQLHQVKNRSLGFGSFTFLFPLITGIAIGRIFHFDWNASLLLGSLLASHSLMTYPIVRRLGVVSNEAVTVTIGATIFTDIGALVVLAICLGIGTGEFTLLKLLSLLVSLTLYVVLILLGFDRAGREFLRRSGADEGSQFLFLLLAVFLAALGAKLIGVEKIVGAFLTGLAVNDAVGDGPVKEKVVFVGSVLFIPIFFVNIGLLIDLSAFLKSFSSLALAVAIIVGLIGSKWLAAFLAKQCYGYSWREQLTMWSMSVPQVATTLAATLVGNQAGLLSDSVLNSVVMMMLVTATLGPLIVSRVAIGLPLPAAALAEELDNLRFSENPQHRPFLAMVPISNPETEQQLLEMAALLVQPEGGSLVPLSIALVPLHLESQRLAAAVQRSEKLLGRAVAISQALGVRVNPLLRIDERIALGISRAAQEQKANLIVMGWGDRTSLQARLFGNTIDNVFWTAPCPVAVVRLKTSPTNLRQILVPLENLSEASLLRLLLAQRIALANSAPVLALQFWAHPPDRQQRQQFRNQLSQLLSPEMPPIKLQMTVLAENERIKFILKRTISLDLVLLHVERHQTSSVLLSLNDLTNQLLQQLPCSVIVLG
jgi:Kef-type K+ transport system membrane component KefB/nucleotide-binding universal stress UspA family protein